MRGDVNNDISLPFSKLRFICEIEDAFALNKVQRKENSVVMQRFAINEFCHAHDHLKVICRYCGEWRGTKTEKFNISLPDDADLLRNAESGFSKRFNCGKSTMTGRTSAVNRSDLIRSRLLRTSC